jgi:hypothetical protein
MKLYRVENLGKGNGLWYHINQDYAGTIIALDLSNKDLPMPFDEKIKQGLYKSAAESIDQLRFWFNFQDLMKLKPEGFKLYEIDVEEHILNETPWYTHPLFQEQHVLSRISLDLDILLPK